jgi:hypothetical protein
LLAFDRQLNAIIRPFAGIFSVIPKARSISPPNRIDNGPIALRIFWGGSPVAHPKPARANRLGVSA